MSVISLAGAISIVNPHPAASLTRQRDSWLTNRETAIYGAALTLILSLPECDEVQIGHLRSKAVCHHGVYVEHYYADGEVRVYIKPGEYLFRATPLDCTVNVRGEWSDWLITSAESIIHGYHADDCPKCGGAGYILAADGEDDYCGRCNGSGEVWA